MRRCADKAETEAKTEPEAKPETKSEPAAEDVPKAQKDEAANKAKEEKDGSKPATKHIKKEVSKPQEGTQEAAASKGGSCCGKRKGCARGGEESWRFDVNICMGEGEIVAVHTDMDQPLLVAQLLADVAWGDDGNNKVVIKWFDLEGNTGPHGPDSTCPSSSLPAMPRPAKNTTPPLCLKTNVLRWSIAKLSKVLPPATWRPSCPGLEPMKLCSPSLTVARTQPPPYCQC